MSVMKQMTHPLSGKKVLVVGLGISGRSAAHFLLKRGVSVFGVDSNKAVVEGEHAEIAQLRQQGMTISYDHLPCDLRQFNGVVISPGVPSTHSYYKQALEIGLDVIGEVELACREMTQKCVAI